MDIKKQETSTNNKNAHLGISDVKPSYFKCRHFKKRQEYINWLYTKKEQNQIKTGIERHREQTELFIQDYLLLDEELRILKKHFNLTDKQFSDIINKYRVKSKGEEFILNAL